MPFGFGKEWAALCISWPWPHFNLSFYLFSHSFATVFAALRYALLLLLLLVLLLHLKLLKAARKLSHGGKAAAHARAYCGQSFLTRFARALRKFRHADKFRGLASFVGPHD